ncbi:MAG: chemotaxis protein CheA [Syntrophales bacterium]
MSYKSLINLLNDMASDYMFLTGPEVDVPAAGKFMNNLDKIAEKASEGKIDSVREVASWLNTLLEKIVLDALSDKEGGFSALGEGIALLQGIVDAYANSGKYGGNIFDFGSKISLLTGVALNEDSNNSAMQENRDPSAETADREGKSPAEGGNKTSSGNKQQSAAELQIEDESLLHDFIVEGLEYIDEIEVNILNLEKDPDNKDYINAIFRPFHSIKGVASFLNLDQIRDLAHTLENLLDKARNGELAVTPSVIDVVLEGADALKVLIGHLKGRLEGNVSAGEDIDTDVPSLMKRVKLVQEGGNEPSGVKKIGEILLEDGIITNADLQEGLKSNAKKLGGKIGETLIKEGKATPKQVSQALRKQAEQAGDMSSIRVDTRKLDDLIDMVGELVINQTMVQEDIKKEANLDRNLSRDIGQLFRITSGLQRISTSLRMVPIKQTFQRMSRLVRDLAKNSGKAVNIDLVGEDTEIDRNMVDEIYNPLVHMVRNSVDHGLESPEERMKAGKTAEGMIRLSAYHRGGSVVIEISDDGRGLNKDKILDKAVRNGLIASGDGLSEQDIYRLIFMPGLSTAEKVTDVSGRGVGMDVVKQAVEKLRGKIDIESSPGKGSKFMAAFPLTMAIIDGMIIRAGSQHYILPMTAVRQALRPRREDCVSVVGRGEMISAMGQLFPLVRLHVLFGIMPEHEDPWDAIVLVLESGNRSKCLLVDKIIGKAEVVIKNLGGGIGKVRGVSGGAILGDGRIGLILDAEGMFEMSETLQERQ